jgi:hypothetical protein
LLKQQKTVRYFSVQHILLTIKCLLIVPNPESALNEEAGKLLLGKKVLLFFFFFSKATGTWELIREPGSGVQI